MSNTTIWTAVALTAAASCAAIVLSASQAQEHKTSAGHAARAVSVERGRYVARIAGCNDCHTAGYAPSGGQVPEAEWLKGDVLGWRGPWGTTYPANLRRVLARYSEDQWVRLARTAQYRPPMPWFALRDMDESDLRSLYRFVRSLKVEGPAAPAYVPPNQTPQGPFVQFPAAPH